MTEEATGAESMKVLVVDDTMYMRKIIQDELQSAGYDTIEVNDGDEVFEKLRSVPNVSLITLDVEMARLSGFETLENLRKPDVSEQLKSMNNEDIPTIFVTSKDSQEDRDRGFFLGAADFVGKPFAKGELLAAVDRILRPTEGMKGFTVLVVEDSRTTRRFISICLKQLGVTVLDAEDGEVAFEMMREDPGKVDLIISDLIMPRMSGDELYRKIKEELRPEDLPIIFLSSSTNKDTVLDLFKMGATDYLMKPFVKEELIARLNAHLERLRLSRSLKGNLAELKSLSKIKDEFLSVCSHDLRSPLNGILGFSDILLDKGNGLDEEQKKMVNYIKTSGNLLLELINDILDLGSIEASREDMKVSSQDLVEIIESCVQTLRHTATPKKVELTLSTHIEEARVNGNRNALFRIVNNLLSNAIKFTPSEGKVSVVVRTSKESKVSISVVDTGIGIPRDKMAELFSKYSKASRSGTDGEKSTGLGLSITKELVAVHGGTIDVRSREGKGSVFTVELPLLVKSKGDDLPEALPTSKDSEGSKGESAPVRILLVEDDLVNTQLASVLLSGFGHTVIAAENGQEGVNFYRQSLKKDRFNLVLMDMEMPVMNGVDATAEIRRLEEKFNKQHKGSERRIPIAAMTANSGEETLAKCRAAGMDDAITKPVNQDMLKEIVEKLVERQ